MDVVTKGTDWPTIVTGIVGVAGIIGTYWQGKRAREATSRDLRESLRTETERALTADRRAVYAGYLAAFSKMLIADSTFEERWNRAPDDTARSALRSAYTETMTELFGATAEVELVAPPAIGGAAATITGAFPKHFNDLAAGKATDGKAIRNAASRQRAAVTLAMRADLGVPSPQGTTLNGITSPEESKQ